MGAEPRTAWTDDRLDNLAREVHEGFRRMDEGFARLDARLDSQGERIDALYRAVFVMAAGISGSILVAAAGITATQL